MRGDESDQPGGRMPEAQPPGEDLGGDPACWLDRVCPECGLFVEDRKARVCPRCDSALLTD